MVTTAFTSKYILLNIKNTILQLINCDRHQLNANIVNELLNA